MNCEITWRGDAYPYVFKGGYGLCLCQEMYRAVEMLLRESEVYREYCEALYRKVAYERALGADASYVETYVKKARELDVAEKGISRFVEDWFARAIVAYKEERVKRYYATLWVRKEEELWKIPEGDRDAYRDHMEMMIEEEKGEE